MTTDPNDLPEAEQDRLIEEGLLDPAAVGREPAAPEPKQLIIPGLEELRDAAEAAHEEIGGYAGLGPAPETPADTATHISKAFVVYSDPRDGTWTASSLVGPATVMRGYEPNVEIVADDEVTVDDFFAACALVQRDITAMATAERTVAHQQMIAARIMEQQHANAIASKLQAQGIRLPGQ